MQRWGRGVCLADRGTEVGYFTAYVMIVATLNLALGFGIATYLGRRYWRMMTSAELSTLATGPTGRTTGLSTGSTAQTSGAIAVEASPGVPAANDQLATQAEVQSEVVSEVQSEPVAAKSHQQSAAPESDAQSEGAAEFTALAAELGSGDRADNAATGRANLAAGQTGETTESPTADQHINQPADASIAAQSQSPVMMPILGMQREVDQYHEKLTEADEALRSRIGPADAAEIEAALKGLIAATEEYLKRREQFQKNLEEAWNQQEQLAPVREQLAEAIHSQDKQIEASREVIEGFDPQGDIPAQHSQAISQTSKLLGANYRLRDALGEAAARVSVAERTAGHPQLPADKDTLTGLDSRVALEERLRQWQQRDPHRIRHLVMAVVDVDRCSKLNERYGSKVGDRVLRAIGQILSSETRNQCDCARVGGQRFALFCADAAVRSVTQLVERIRQIVELTHFHLGQEELQVTVSCAVTALRPDDQREDLFSRLENTLREAKRYGRNRTFVHEGEYPTPVVPPNFALEEKHLTL